MPYIIRHKRPTVYKAAVALREVTGNDSGNLNYAITTLLNATDPKCYNDYQSLVGLVECVKLEFYRRAVVAYEEEKIAENGDIYLDYPKG